MGMEVGVWLGAYSDKMLQIAKPAILHLVDPWRQMDASTYCEAWYGGLRTTQLEMDQRYEQVKTRFSEQIQRGQVVVHRANSTGVFQGFPDNALDYVYIDGDHTFDAVLADLTNAFRVVKTQGLICGDDYRLGGWWRDGVVRALHQFLPRHAVTIHFVQNGQFMLRKL
jgi:Methyltransferase domain